MYSQGKPSFGRQITTTQTGISVHTPNSQIYIRRKNSTVVTRVAKKSEGEEEVVYPSPVLERGVEANGVQQGVERAGSVKTPSQYINIIPVGRWPDGIPPAMGGHYLPSGDVAPLSTSKGPGVDIHPLYFVYPQGETETQVIVHENGFSAAQGLADIIANASARAVADKGSFTLALSGGSLVKSLSALVGRSDIDFSNWYILFSDERNVPLSNEESNYKAALEEVLSKVPIPSSQILTIKEGLTAAQAAEHYAGQMLNLSQSVLPRTDANEFPVIDMVLLGVGPDGHVASLFPNSSVTAATEGWVLPVTNSPKPPSERITLSLPVINAAKQVVVTALGEGKAEIVQRALEVQSLPGALPVQMVRPQDTLTWVLDNGSASHLSVDAWEEKKKFPRNL